MVARSASWWCSSWSAAPRSAWRSASAGAELLRRVALPVAGFYPLAMLALCVLAFATASLAHTSGFVAVYLCGVVLGNAALPHRSASIGFAEGMASLAQIGLFVLLGLLASPPPAARRARPGAGRGRRAAAGRPAAVGGRRASSGSACPGRSRRSSPGPGLRGAVPIVLATFPLTFDVPGATIIFDTVFVLVVVFTARAGLVAALGRPPAADRRADHAPRRRGGVRAAGRARRRPHAAHRAARLPAARRLPAGAAAARGRRGRPRRPRRALLRPRRHHPAACAGDQALLVAARRSRPRPSAGCAR